MEKFNWGIIGCGTIAEQMAKALRHVENAVLYAAASRSTAKAENFAKTFGFAKHYGDYDSLLNDKNVNVIYIATPHINHVQFALQSLNAGKSVLCEKPACINQTELEKVLAAAKANNCFFMEAMWMKFQPAFAKAMQYINSGKIGKLQAVYADICFPMEQKPGSRLYEPDLAGGALLDLGIYSLTVAFSSISSAKNIEFSKAEPQNMVSVCQKTNTGVDGFELISFKYEDCSAVLTSGMICGCGSVTRQAKFIGSNGSIVLNNFWYGESLKLYDAAGKLAADEALPFDCNGYEYEARAVQKCINEGLLECKTHSWQDSLFLCRTMDTLRKEWGVVYPTEV